MPSNPAFTWFATPNAASEQAHGNVDEACHPECKELKKSMEEKLDAVVPFDEESTKAYKDAKDAYAACCNRNSDRDPLKTCGPDVTAFVSALATNILNGTMTRGQAYTAVLPMIGSGDLKNYAGVPRAAILGKHPCPKDCPQSVTLGELCVSDQIPGNLLFGLILGAKNAWDKARELHAGEDSLEDTDSYQVGESIANEWAKPAATRGRGPLDRARARAKEITAMGNLIAKKLKERADNNRMRAKVNEFMGGNNIDREHEGILDRPCYVCSKGWPQ